MHLTQEDLRDLVARSSRLSERAAGGFVVARSGEPDAQKLAQTRLAQWKKNLLAADARAFQERLALSGQTVESIVPLLGRVELDPGAEIPSWARVLEEVVSRIAPADLGATSEDSSPFEEITRPFVAWAEEQLLRTAGDAAVARCSAGALNELKAGLGRWLNSLAAPTLISEFTAFRAVRQQLRGALGGVQLFGSLPGIISREHYQEFIRHLQSGGLCALFREYPVLARLMAEVTELWVASESEFLRHLQADWASLMEAFPAPEKRPEEFGADAPEQVQWLRTDLSDRHHHGRTVKLLSFTSGRRCVYKPKSLALEAALASLQEWLNDRFAREGGSLAEVPFQIPRLITCADHGWVECVTRQACADADAVRRFYRRAGMLTCLVYALEGTDYHNENLIAHGEHPIPIDQEGLFHHRGRFMNADGDEFGADLTANSRIAHSVIRTAILPYWRFGEEGRSVDVSALGGEPGQESMIKSPRWANVNTDQMALVYEYLTSREAGGNVVFLGEERQSANDYLPELTQGFREMYDFLSAHRDELLTEVGPIAPFNGQTVRFIYRDTRVYFVLQRHALNTRFLRDGVDRSIQLEVLYRGFFNAEEGRSHPFLPLLEAEQFSLEGMDIPLLEPRTDRADLLLETGKAIPDAFVRPSFAEVKARLAGLSDEDRDFQLELMSGSLLTRTVRPQQEGAAGAESRGSGARLAAFPPEELVRESLRIAAQMSQRALWRDDSHATWIGFVHVIEANRAQLQQLPNRLYDGSLGLAMFFGALPWVVRERFPALGDEGTLEGFRRLARATVQPLLDLWEKSQGHVAAMPELKNELVAQIGIGGGMGIGSAIYCLTRLSGWLDEPTYLDTAVDMALAIDDEVIASDGKCDLMFGSAGTILGLLALWRVRNDARVLDRAVACGRHLLARREASPSGHLSWRASPGGPFLTGLSHGAAGFAHALAALAKASGDETFLTAAREAVAYENAVFRPAEKNWPDFRSSPEHSASAPCWCSWCHGAPGIGLMRLEMPAGSADTERDIAAALETTARHGITDIDHLCCGNLGRADLLLEAGQRLHRPDLMDEARTLTSEVVVRSRQTGGYRLGNSGAYSLSLFQGSAGIGYELLRMAAPADLPTVLLWE